MFNRSASLTMSTSILEALPGNLVFSMYLSILFFPVVEFAIHHGHLCRKREHHPLAYQLFWLLTKYMYNVHIFIFLGCLILAMIFEMLHFLGIT